MEQKIVWILLDFSFTHFVGIELDSHVNLSDEIRSLEKHSPLISGLSTHLFVKVPRPGDSEVTFSVFESSCHMLLPV